MRQILNGENIEGNVCFSPADNSVLACNGNLEIVLEQVTDSGANKIVLGVEEPRLSLDNVDSKAALLDSFGAIHESSTLSMI